MGISVCQRRAEGLNGSVHLTIVAQIDSLYHPCDSSIEYSHSPCVYILMVLEAFCSLLECTVNFIIWAFSN